MPMLSRSRFEELEFVQIATRAGRLLLRMTELQAIQRVGPHVKLEQVRTDVLAAAGQDFDGLHGLKGRDGRNGHTEHTHLSAILFGTRQGGIFQQTAQARGLPRHDRGRLRFCANDTCKDPRQTFLHAIIVHEIARGEVVRAVNHNVDVLSETIDIDSVQPFRGRLDKTSVVNFAEVQSRGLDLVSMAAGVVLSIQRLAVDIGRVDIVIIDQPEEAHTRTGEQFGDPGPKTTDTDQQCPAVHERFLSAQAKGFERNLAYITIPVDGLMCVGRLHSCRIRYDTAPEGSASL